MYDEWGLPSVPPRGNGCFPYHSMNKEIVDGAGSAVILQQHQQSGSYNAMQERHGFTTCHFDAGRNRLMHTANTSLVPSPDYTQSSPVNPARLAADTNTVARRQSQQQSYPQWNNGPCTEQQQRQTLAYQMPRDSSVQSTPPLPCHLSTLVDHTSSCMYTPDRARHHGPYFNGVQEHWIMPEFAQDPTMRSRPCFTTHQTRELEREFSLCQYITRRRRIEMAYVLSLTEKQIKTWFQNRRVKERKMKKSESD